MILRLAMEPQAFPPSPIFPSIREATTQDINRMAELSVLAFQDSEIFRFVRPGCNKYPWDTVASFVRFWRSQLRNPRVVVLVSEDWKLLGERRVPCPCSKQVPRDSLGLLNERVVVGVCSWRFPSGSRREGQFACLGVGDYKAPKSRDLDPERSQALDSIRLDAEQKYVSSVANTGQMDRQWHRPLPTACRSHGVWTSDERADFLFFNSLGYSLA